MSQNPAISVLENERQKAAAAVDSLSDQLRQAKAALASFDQALGILNAPSGNLELQARPIRSGTVMDRIIDILIATPGISSTQITEELARQGRPTDPNSVLSTLSRLKRDGRIIKENKIWFVYEKPVVLQKIENYIPPSDDLDGGI